MIFLTGASGNLGGGILEHLLKRIPADTIAALVRNADKAKILEQKGIHVFIGDYANKPSLINSLQGADQLLLISSNGEHAQAEHKNVIDAARETGVKHIYYTGGALNKNVPKSQLGVLADAYITTEDYIIDSGLAYTIFQNGLYAETIPYFIGEQVLETGIRFSAGDGKASFTKREEMGEVIANVLVTEGHENKIYLLTVEPTYSFSGVAHILSELSGKEVAYDSPRPDEYTAELKANGVSDGDIWFSSLFAAIIKNGEYDVRGPDLEKLLGRKPTDLETYLTETFLK